MSAPEPGTIVLVIDGPIGPAHVRGLCERARALLEGSDAERLLCDVGALTRADAVAVDALARLQLVARRLGRRLVLLRASPELRDLLAFVGLREALPCAPVLRVEARGQPEEREERVRVEEEREPDDPAA